MLTDYFGKPADLKDKKLWLLDMDGTVYLGDRLFDGTLDFLSTVQEQGGTYVFITNNSSRSVIDYVKKVQGMGIPAGEENFFTSSQATILYLRKNYPGALVYCQGTRSLIRELKEGGIRVTEEMDKVDVVLTGFDTELNFEKLSRTSQILTEQDVVYIATNPDLVCPVNFGYVPDNGSVAIMLKNATGKEPTYIGKPEPAMIQIAMEKFSMRQDQTVVIGDRLYTDIASGVNAGVTTMLVLSGEATLDTLEKSPVKPTYVFEGIRKIQQALKEAG